MGFLAGPWVLHFSKSGNVTASMKDEKIQAWNYPDACELIQEAQLLNEHYDLNTRADSINLPSTHN